MKTVSFYEIMTYIMNVKYIAVAAAVGRKVLCLPSLTDKLLHSNSIDLTSFSVLTTNIVLFAGWQKKEEDGRGGRGGHTLLGKSVCPSPPPFPKTKIFYLTDDVPGGSTYVINNFW